ncbi:hypothetical protein TNCV_243851 [Trichonephila clavipes]|uniref:DUF4817 domain-containing protein n=1 Tax=Trichonephila clavipes TaxID=2585209 RepID=A0A8X6V2A5_TRICX|nr:hypothetical protein TNCV_243851 [Trichonephila clavipes]
MERVEWDICVTTPVSNILCSRQQRAPDVEAYFSNGRSGIALQRVFRRHFDIPPRGHVPDQKSLLKGDGCPLSNEECLPNSLPQMMISLLGDVNWSESSPGYFLVPGLQRSFPDPEKPNEEHPSRN